MKKNNPVDRSADFERALEPGVTPETYKFRLYVTGSTPKSSKAIRNIREMCENYLPGRYELEVVDIYQQPVAASAEQIIAAPTLIKRLPAPLQKMIGDLSNIEHVLMRMNVTPPSGSDKTNPDDREIHG